MREFKGRKKDEIRRGIEREGWGVWKGAGDTGVRNWESVAWGSFECTYIVYWNLYACPDYNTEIAGRIRYFWPPPKRERRDRGQEGRRWEIGDRRSEGRGAKRHSCQPARFLTT